MRLLLSAILLAVAGSAGLGQEAPVADSGSATGIKLRWKFDEGQNLQIKMLQEMTQEMSVVGQKMTTNMTNETWSNWETRNVEDDGTAKIKSEVSRIVMKLSNPTTGNITIDTNNNPPEEGQAAKLDEMVRPMVGVEITNLMSPRGKVSDVKIPGEAFAGLQGAAGGMALSADQMGEMMQKVSPVFPDQLLKSGDSWNVKSEVGTPVGDMKVDTTYTYEGPVDVEGKSLHSISVELKMDFEAPEGGPAIKFGDQSSKGVMLFDNDAGRLVRSDVEQSFKLTIEAAPGQTVEQTITQSTANVVTPVESK